MLIEFWKLPVGTVVKARSTSDTRTWEYKIISDHRFTYTHNESKYTKIFDVDGMTLTMDERITVIYPHGYQTPLWRVLNGEA